MNTIDFNYCFEEALKMHNSKPVSPYVKEVHYDECGNWDKEFYLKVAASNAASGSRFTIDKMIESAAKVRSTVEKKPRIKTDCTKCGGDGAVVAKGFAYSCKCAAGENYPAYPKHDGEYSESLKVTEFDDHYIREFDGYKIKTPKNISSVKEVSFEHGLSIIPKPSKHENKLKKISDFF